MPLLLIGLIFIAVQLTSAQISTAPCGIAAYAGLQEVGKGIRTVLFTLNLTDSNSSQIYELPYSVSFSSYALPQTGQMLVFYSDRMVAITVANGNITSYNNWSTPFRSNGGHYGESGMKFAGFDSSKSILYAAQSSTTNSPTWTIYASNFAAQRWDAITNITVPVNLTHYFFTSALTRDNSAVVVLITNSLNGHAAWLSVYNLTTRAWGSTKEIAFPDQSWFSPLYATAANDMLVFLQTRNTHYPAIYSIATGALVAKLPSTLYQTPYAQMALTHLSQRNQYLLPGCSTERSNSSANVQLFDVDKGTLAYDWYVPAPLRTMWSVACAFTWMAIGCPFR